MNTRNTINVLSVVLNVFEPKKKKKNSGIVLK